MSVKNGFAVVAHGKFESAMFRLGQALGEQAEGVVNRLNSDPTFVANLAEFALTGGYKPPTSHLRARQIMGKNFFGPDDAMKHFGTQVTRRQLVALSEVPFSEETLIACKETHILIAIPAASILEIRELVSKLEPPEGQRKFFCNQDWYDKEAFAKEKGQVGWYLVSKTPVQNSIGQNWDGKQELLGKDDETPSAQVMIYTMLAYFLSTGERLFEEIWVHCSDLDLNGRHICVGIFNVCGLALSNGASKDLTGLSSTRK